MWTALAALLCAAILGAAPLAAQQAPAFPSYQESDAGYRIFPGDQIEVIVYSAPELTRVVTVAPDGRIYMPLIGAIMAANRTSEELETDLVVAYAPHLRTPEIEVSPRAFTSQQVFVGGEVSRPGVIDLASGMDALQAVTAAGGFLNTARRRQVLVMTREPGGAMSVRFVDLSAAALRRGMPDAAPLRRFDVVYVPRSGIANVNLFMQQYVRDALPIQFSLFYDLRGDQ